MPQCDKCGKKIERPRTVTDVYGYQHEVCSDCFFELKKEEQTKDRPEGGGLPNILKRKWWGKNL